MRLLKGKTHRPVFLTVWMLGVTGCALLRQAFRLEKPTVHISDVHLNRLDFHSMDLAVTLDVRNPNPIGIRLAGFTYDFRLEDHPFFSGQKTQAIAIPARGEVPVEIPMTLSFEAIRSLLGVLAERDSARFALKAKLIFDLPGVGPHQITAEKTGHLPILKLPPISLSRLQVIRLGWTGAEVELELLIENPNPFSFRIRSLHGTFSMQSSPWITGQQKNPVEIPKKGSKETVLNFTLDFAQIGNTVYSLLQQGKGLTYRFQGELVLNSSIQAMGEILLPIDLAGTIIPKH